MAEGSPLKLRQLSTLTTNLSKCSVCQNEANETLFVAQRDSISKFLKAATIRDGNVFEKVNPEAEELLVETVLWHKNCYKSYTSKTNLERFEKISADESEQQCEAMETEQQRLTRRSLEGSSVDWQLCLFCQKSKYKGSKQLVNLCTRQAEESLRKTADILNDDAMKMKTALPNLIEQEAKYHKACHQLCMANALKFPTKGEEETICEKAFASFTGYIEKSCCKSAEQ